MCAHVRRGATPYRVVSRIQMYVRLHDASWERFCLCASTQFVWRGVPIFYQKVDKYQINTVIQ